MLNKTKVSIFLYSLSSGGAERVVSILVKELTKKYEITLILMNDTIFYNIPQDINIIYLENSNPNENGIKKLFKLPFLALRYTQICKELNIKVSFSFMNRPNYINVLSKIFGNRVKVIVSERSTPSKIYEKNTIQSKINKFLIKKLYSKADIVTSNSYGNAKDLKINFNILNVEVLKNPFNLIQIEKMSKQDIGIIKEKFTFVTVGRLDEGKNHKLIIDAIKDLDANLWIIGDGELKSYLNTYINKQKLNHKVFFLGKQQNPFSFLSKVDAFIFSSNHEGFPNVLVEALACGLPIISTDCLNGPREILAPLSNQDEMLQKDLKIVDFGVLTPIKDVEKLTESMNLLLKNHKLVQKYRDKAKLRAKDFELNKVIDDYIRVIDA